MTHLILSEDEIRKRLTSDLAIKLEESISKIVRAYKYTDVLGSLEHMMKVCHQDYTSEHVASFLERLKSSIDPSHIESQHPLTYPHLFPFILDLSPKELNNQQAADERDKPLVREFKIEGYTHEEFLSSLV